MPGDLDGREQPSRRDRQRRPQAQDLLDDGVEIGRVALAQAGAFRPDRWLGEEPKPNPLSWIPFGGGVRRCTGAPFAEMEMREVLRAAADLRIRPVRPEPERARRSMLVVVPDRGGEVLVG